MIFWLIIAAMTVCALAFVVWPFVFSGSSAQQSGGDMAVYRDQLEELDRDRNAGLIDEAEQQAARIEVSRRLLKAADAAGPAAQGQAGAGEARAARIAALIVAVLVIPALSAGLYYRLGAPGAAQPKAQTAAAASGRPSDASIADMISKVESHLQRNPDDAKSWEVLAPVYMRLGRYDDAVNSWRNIVRLKGETAESMESMGESMVAAADGVVTEEAKAAFDRALSLDKEAIAARYYRGLAALQDGRNDDARKIWSDLVASAPPGASWADSVRQSLARLDGKAPPLPERPAAQNGPNAKQMQDAANLPQDQQDEMIRGMVDKLAARLKLNGDDPNGWAQLVRSWAVIGDQQRADQALTDARKALSASPVKLAMFEEAVKEMAAAAPQQAAPAPPPPPAVAAETPKVDGDAIRGMVQKLADRLKQNGDDPNGWLRLVNSWTVLGETDKVEATIADARKALAADADKLAQFDHGLRALKAN